MTQQAINQAIEEIRAAKQAETEANAKRVKAEQTLIALLKFEKSEGSSTETVGNYKVKLTAKINRRLDEQAWKRIVIKIPQNLRPVKEQVVYKVDDKGCRYLQNNEPEIWELISEAIIETPAKVAVNIEVM